jgi:hypothetical protein
MPPPDTRLHVDDRLWPADGVTPIPGRLEVRCLAGAATLLDRG